ncbi:serine hydrolase domain-containing protein [Flavihumibacter profundi]|uniref:serine hydrolase domain-containing protein n=1 Tax=Flavihumibacter profundi TaxID=2716883 RepID=UPI001CC4E54B|nr:serine hydrolase [Flavihumibacter profundi]MBZ5856505.1 beta-lactamase family protein [Flavihumibacter profundi]
MKKVSVGLLKRTAVLLFLALLLYGVRYAWLSFPIITGYNAKMACSCVFLSGRELENVEAEELGSFPLKMASIKLDTSDHSVTASLFGMARQKAIYRPGLGCTLVNEIPEAEIRRQLIKLATHPDINQDTIPWPQGDLLPDSFPPGVQREKLEKAVQYAFTEKDPGKLWRTRGVIVLYDGKLVAEHYAPGFDRHTPMLSWSMAKSITGTLIGILVGQGKLNVHQPAPVQEWRSVKDGRENISLENLLQQTSGLDFEENYSKSSSATNMLFRRADMGAFTASIPYRDRPGTKFYYTSGNTNVLSRIIRQTVGEQEYHAFPAKVLFHKLGMFSAVMEPDASGTFVGSSYVFANARDWARFGLFYANNGIWGTERILPENWVKEATTPCPVAPQGEYGYQFWLNAGQAGNAVNRKFPDLPSDMYYADGYEGQFVFIIPSKKLVVVRLGQTAGDWFDASGFLSRIISALP